MRLLFGTDSHTSFAQLLHQFLALGLFLKYALLLLFVLQQGFGTLLIVALFHKCHACFRYLFLRCFFKFGKFFCLARQVFFFIFLYFLLFCLYLRLFIALVFHLIESRHIFKGFLCVGFCLLLIFSKLFCQLLVVFQSLVHLFPKIVVRRATCTHTNTGSSSTDGHATYHFGGIILAAFLFVIFVCFFKALFVLVYIFVIFIFFIFQVYAFLGKFLHSLLIGTCHGSLHNVSCQLSISRCRTSCKNSFRFHIAKISRIRCLQVLHCSLSVPQTLCVVLCGFIKYIELCFLYSRRAGNLPHFFCCLLLCSGTLFRRFTVLVPHGDNGTNGYRQAQCQRCHQRTGSSGRNAKCRCKAGIGSRPHVSNLRHKFYSERRILVQGIEYLLNAHRYSHHTLQACLNACEFLVFAYE